MSELEPRPYNPEKDIRVLSRLLTRVEDHDHNGEDPSESALRDMLTWPNFEPENDCWVIPNPDQSGELIGYGSTYAQTAVRCYSFIAIDPDWRRRGLGSRLLQKVIDRTQARGATELSIDASDGNPDAKSFLASHNFEAVGHSWIMRRPADLAVSSPEWPEGFTIRRYPEFNEPQYLADALNAFIDMWGHGQNERPTTAETVVTGYLGYYSPEGVFVAFAPDGSAAGFVAMHLNEKEDDHGVKVDVLDGPGIVPKHRHLDLQRQLVQAALQYQQSRSPNAVELQSWGDPPETAVIYNDLGFKTTAHFISYFRELN